jgi:Histidine kinase-, DNA gyrase B-, and HSP90-like ATPase
MSRDTWLAGHVRSASQKAAFWLKDLNRVRILTEESQGSLTARLGPHKMHPIKLSSKTLAHISSGLYRSTANALKELVSNAFDADATLVELNTNFPHFDVLTCRDNGNGMTQQEFVRLMDGGIGNSIKRIGALNDGITERGRPIIGRIGIGLLAIAQVCLEFKIISHHRVTRTAFEATVDINPYGRPDIAAAELAEKEDYEIGKYECRGLPYDEKKAGVFVVSKDLRRSYADRYRGAVKREEFKQVPLNSSFQDLL